MGVPVLPGKGAWGNDVNGNQVNQTNSATSIWALILGALQQIVALGGGGGGGGGNVTIVGPGTVTTPTKTTVNTNGTVAAGKTHVEFITSIDCVGTILGDAITGAPSSNIPVSVITFDAPPWAPLAAIPYTLSAGSLTIITSVTA